MPNDIPDWTGQNKVNLVGGVSGLNLGDVGAPAATADQAQESATAPLGVSSSTAALGSFKPSGTPALVKAGALISGTTGAVSPAFGQATAAGHLLVAVVSAYGAAPTTAQAGWAQVVDSNPGGGGTHCAIWTKPNCGNNETAPAFTGGLGPGLMQAILMEFSGVATASPTDQTGGIFQPNSQLSITVNATAIDGTAQDLEILGVVWRNGSTPFTATFSQAFNNSAAVTHVADNGSSSLSDHLSVTFAILPAVTVAQPLGVAPWDYDVIGTSRPATGSQASVVLAATPGKSYHVHKARGSASAQTATASALDLQLKDGANLIQTDLIGVTAAVGSEQAGGDTGEGIKITQGNSCTLAFNAAVGNVNQAVNIGAYLR